MVVDKGE